MSGPVTDFRNYSARRGQDELFEFCICVVLVLRVWYAPVGPDGVPDMDREFVVQTEHYPLQGPAKLRAAEITKRMWAVQPLINIGDFNLFRDDKEHDAIYAKLTEEKVDATKTLTDQHGQPMYGTFYPFPRDKPPVSIARPEENSPHVSKLDYAFVSKDSTKIRPKKAWLLTGLQDATTGVPISDHLLLLVQVELL